MKFVCQNCNTTLSVPDEYMGKPFNCPSCHKQGIVPAAPGSQVRAQSSPPVRTAQAEHKPSRPAASSAGTNVFGGQILKHFVIGLLLTLAFYGALFGAATQFPLAQKFTDRGWTPYAAVLLAFWSASVLVGKLIGVRRRQRSLGESFVPANAVLDTPEGIENTITASAAMAAEVKDVILGRRIRRALEHFKATWSVGEVSDLLREESQSDFDAMQSSYMLVRMFVWMIPILGFIGTVIGVSDAVGGFASFLSVAQEVDEITTALTKVTQGLGVAFDTTFVALVLSVLVMIAMSSVQKMEQDQLLLFETYCQNHVLRRLPSKAAESSQEKAPSVTIEDVRDVVKELVPGIEMWREEAQGLAKTLAEGLTKAWEHAGREWANGVGQVTAAITTAQTKQEEWLHQTVKEREAVEKSARTLLTQVRDLLQSEQDNLRKVLEVEQKAVTDSVQKQHNMVQQYVGALQRTAGKLGELVELQNRLEEGLLKASGSDGLAAALGEVRQLLQHLDPAVNKLANEPLNVEVSFVAGAATARAR